MAAPLAHVPGSELTARLYELRRQERHRLVEFLQYLGEVERRGLHVELGFESLFVFLTEHLGYPKACAYRRSTAARLLARFPVVGDYLADGRLCLTTLVALRDVLDDTVLDEVLHRAAGRSEDDVKRLVAALQPQPAPPDLIRRRPAPIAASVSTASAPPPPPSAPSPPPARVTPIAATQHVLRATVSDDFVRDLEAVRAALGHQLPCASLETVLHECVRVTLAACEKRRRGSGKSPVTGKDSSPGRYIPAAVRDEVWRRDGGRCAFVGKSGHVCGSTTRVEFHHIEPFARGGAATVANLTLRCSTHNRYEAQRDFGAEHVERAIRRSRHGSLESRQASLF